MPKAESDSIFLASGFSSKITGLVLSLKGDYRPAFQIPKGLFQTKCSHLPILVNNHGLREGVPITEESMGYPSIMLRCEPLGRMILAVFSLIRGLGSWNGRDRVPFPSLHFLRLHVDVLGTSFPFRVHLNFIWGEGLRWTLMSLGFPSPQKWYSMHYCCRYMGLSEGL